VLLLYGEPRLTPALVAVDARFRATLESQSPVPVTFYTEYLDLNLFDGGAPQPELRELLRRKYAERPIDLILAAGSRALRVALHNRKDLFSDAPVVFVAVDPTAAADLRMDADVTGTWLRTGWTETLELARRLQPGARRVMVIGGVSPADRVWLSEARKQLGGQSGSIQIAYLTDRSLDDILKEVAALPPATVALFGTFLRDVTGRDFSTPDAARRIAAAASVPVYGLTDNVVGTGAVGGQVVTFDAHGQIAAELALRVLAGERPAPTAAGTLVPMVDARQVRRWGLDARRLPAGSVVLFEEPSVWARYRWYIIGAVGALLLQGGLIGGLLVQRAQRRRAQERLAERLRFETLLSELSTKLAASAPAEAERSIGNGLQSLGEGLGIDWATLRGLEDRADEARVMAMWTRDGVEPRPPVIREDQTPWIFARLRQGHVVRLTQPTDLPAEAALDRRSLQEIGAWSAVVVPLMVERAVVGWLSLGTVRTGRRWPEEWVPRLRLLAEAFATALERQRAARATRESQEAIRDLAGRLMTAQEEERRRIARDLHDDVSQELAAQSMALSALGDRLSDVTPPAMRDDVARLQARTVHLANAIRNLSHSLHPGTLQHAGLVAALRGYCRDFEREHDLAVTFRGDGGLDAVSADVALCLYRVTQEGLGNVARHAGARHTSVTVGREHDDVILTIADDGRGFDLAEARHRHGLGLISLDERVRLVGGRLTIESQSQRGTELRIVVPLSEAWDAPRDRAAG
jgi:signal transduction histidine kinase